jgi:hypothetical protein
MLQQAQFGIKGGNLSFAAASIKFCFAGTKLSHATTGAVQSYQCIDIV